MANIPWPKKLAVAADPALVRGWKVERDDRIGLMDVVRNFRPTVLVGASGQTGAFTEPIVREMARHCPRPVVEAVQDQVATLIHVPNTWHTDVQGRWAQLLSEKSFGGQAFFCNSGTEANEAAIKLARLHTPKERYKIITVEVTNPALSRPVRKSTVIAPF